MKTFNLGKRVFVSVFTSVNQYAFNCTFPYTLQSGATSKFCSEHTDFGVDNKTVCVLQFDTGGVSGGRILCDINHFLCTRTGIRHTIEGYFIKVSEESVSARPFLKHKSVTQTVSASFIKMEAASPGREDALRAQG